MVVVFKEEVNEADATNTANYSIDGAVVKNAELAADKKTVTLTLEDNKTEYRGARYITISNVRTSGNVAMKESFRKVIELNENIAPTVKGVAVTSNVENTGDSTKMYGMILLQTSVYSLTVQKLLE